MTLRPSVLTSQTGKILSHVYVIVCYISRRIKKRVILVVLTAVTIKFTVLCDVIPCSLVDIYRRFSGACCFQHLRRPKNLCRLFSKTSKHISQSTWWYVTEDGCLLIYEAAWNFNQKVWQSPMISTVCCLHSHSSTLTNYSCWGKIWSHSFPQYRRWDLENFSR